MTGYNLLAFLTFLGGSFCTFIAIPIGFMLPSIGIAVLIVAAILMKITMFFCIMQHQVDRPDARRKLYEELRVEFGESFVPGR